MDHESKQGQGQGHGKRKKKRHAASGNGVPDDLPSELKTEAKAANEAAKQSVDKGIDAWKKIVAEAPKAWAPRRALARSVQEGGTLERVHRGAEGGRREDELGGARGQDSDPRGDDRGLSRSPEAGRDGRQRVQPDPQHPAGQLRRRRRAGRAVRGDEALAGSDRAAAQEGGGRRVGRGQDRAAREASRICSSRSSRTRRRRSRPTKRSSSWIPTTARRSGSSSRCTRSAATGKS